MTLNRAARRRLKETLKAHVGTLAHPVPASVALHGGPMDGWIVKPDAPALRPDWYTTWPPSVEATHKPGRYELREGGQDAKWVVS